MNKLSYISQQPKGKQLGLKTKGHNNFKIKFLGKGSGIAFLVIFINKNYHQQHESQPELQYELVNELNTIRTKLELCWNQVGTKLAPGWNQVVSKQKYHLTKKGEKLTQSLTKNT